MLDTGDPNPHWFNYPSLYLYATALVLGAGRLLAPASLGTLELQGLLYLIGRGLTAACGTATVYLIFLTGRRLSGVAAGLAAGLVLALAPLHSANSHFITTDVPAGLFVALSLWLAARGRRGSQGWLVASAAAAGLAAATKYNAGLALFVPLAFWATGRAGTTRHWRTPLLVGAAALAGFLVAMPWLLLDRGTVLSGIRFEIEHYRGGHEGFEGSDNWRFYPLYLFTDGLTPGLALFAVAGWVLLLARDRWLCLALSAFALAYYALLAGQTVRFERNLVPLLPLLAIFAGLALAEAVRAVSVALPLAPQRAAGAAVLLALVGGWPLYRTTRYDYLMSQTDTRTTAATWMDRNLPAGATLCQEAYAPPVDSARFVLSNTWALANEPLSAYRGRGCDYLVASSLMYGRYVSQPERYPAKAAFYSELFASWPLVAKFSGHPLPVHDPVIRVYSVPR